MRIAIAATLSLAALLLTSPADAQRSAATYRCDKGVISEGRSTADLIAKCGNPDRTVQLENGFGAAVAERWEYYRDGATVMFTIQRGKVVKIMEAR